MAQIITAPTAPETQEFVSPCGCSACEKWADCAYCGTCAEQDPWTADWSEEIAAAQWDRENAGSLADWFAGR